MSDCTESQERISLLSKVNLLQNLRSVASTLRHEINIFRRDLFKIPLKPRGLIIPRFAGLPTDKMRVGDNTQCLWLSSSLLLLGIITSYSFYAIAW